MSAPKVCVVTLTFGDMRHTYERIFIPSIKAFAQKHGYDFKQILEPILLVESAPQANKKHVLWMQKLLIPRIPGILNYDWVIYIDADILINYENTPNILSEVVQGKICAVNEREIFGRSDLITKCWKSMNPYHPSTAEDYYRHLKFPETFSKQFNCGFFCFEPKIHKDFFEELFQTYSPRVFSGEDLDGDQGVLNYETNKRRLIHYIDSRWNCLWMFPRFLLYKFLDPFYDKNHLQQAFKTIFNMNYCIHMAGNCDWDLLE